MASESGLDSGPSFCGNCGAVVEADKPDCGVCGRPLAAPFVEAELVEAERPGPASNPAPADYVPYCRNCGVGVPWGQGHTCLSCGVSPLCELHFRASDSLCLDCASAPAYSGAGARGSGLYCGVCGASAFPSADFCQNCGRALSFASSASSRSEAGEYVGFWMRAGAFVVDWIIAYVVAALLAAVIGVSLTSGDVDPAAMEDISIALNNLNYNFLLLFWGLSVAHAVLLTGLRGQTLGKMLLRIQVVDVNGNIPAWRWVLTRELIRGVVLLALFPLGLIYLRVAFDPRFRGWHDQLGRCYVVRKRREDSRPDGGF